METGCAGLSTGIVKQRSTQVLLWSLWLLAWQCPPRTSPPASQQQAAATAEAVAVTASIPVETMALPSLGGDYFRMQLGAPWVVRGAPFLHVIRLPAQVKFVPHDFAGAGFTRPPTLLQWHAKLAATLLLNAGQYDGDGQYLGWLKAHGQWINHRRKSGWLALLVSEPQQQAALPFAQLMDLSSESTDSLPAYRHAMQSMMLVDEHGQIRTRRSRAAASRMVIAQTTSREFLLILVEGAITLYDLGEFLRTSSLHIYRAMNLDGGLEAQMCLHSPEWSHCWHGQVGSSSFLQSDQVQTPLPYVVEVVALAQ